MFIQDDNLHKQYGGFIMRTSHLFIIFLISTFFLTVCTYSQSTNPIESYDSYQDAVKKAGSIDDLKPFISSRKYNELISKSKEQQASALKTKQQIVQDSQRKDISSTINGLSAALTVKIIDTSNNLPATVDVNLVKEDGVWKVDKGKFRF